MNDWNVGLMAHLGMRFVEVGPDKVVAELEVREELATVGGALHGGTLMALADTVGAAGTAAMGLRTATLESKTNFFAAALRGKVRAESTRAAQGQAHARLADPGNRRDRAPAVAHHSNPDDPVGMRGALALIVLAMANAAHGFDLQGHRGARGHAPENTLPGFELAARDGRHDARAGCRRDTRRRGGHPP